jgi:hypothetical protein
MTGLDRARLGTTSRAAPRGRWRFQHASRSRTDTGQDLRLNATAAFPFGRRDSSRRDASEAWIARSACCLSANRGCPVESNRRVGAGRKRRSPTSIDDQALTLQRLSTLVQLGVFSVLFFFKGWVRVSPIHMALSIVPSLVVMAVWQIELRPGAAKVLFGVCITCLLFISLPPMRNALARFAENLAWLQTAVLR